MKKDTIQLAEKALKHLFIGSQLDGIKFGVSDATTFIYFLHDTNREVSQLWIHIESLWDLFPTGTKQFPNTKEEMKELSADEKYYILYSLRREKITDIKLGCQTPHLYITFESGKTLFVYGYDEKFECWQAGDGAGFTGDNWLVVAVPQNSIATWLPQEQ